MPTPEITPINAGSMADIAFLLLIFFLVTTTMDVDQGITRILPSITEEPPDSSKINRNKVLEIMVNQFDQLLVEEEAIDLSRLHAVTTDFLTNGGVFRDTKPLSEHVAREWVNELQTKERANHIRAKIKSKKFSNTELEKDLRRLQRKLDAIRFFGPFKELDKSAVISLQNSTETSYDMYIQVQNELTTALNTLRDELCQEKFGRNYLEFDIRIPEERRIVEAVREVYPQRISEAEPF